MSTKCGRAINNNNCLSNFKLIRTVINIIFKNIIFCLLLNKKNFLILNSKLPVINIISEVVHILMNCIKKVRI